MNWIFSPPFGAKVAAAIVVALVLLAVWRWRRERRGLLPLLLRIAASGILLVVLLNPQALTPRERNGRPRMTVLLDASSSMAVKDVKDAPRLGAALRVLTNAATMQALQRDFAVDFKRFDAQAQPADLLRLSAADATGEASDLGRAIMSAAGELGDVPGQAGVMVVSDGRATAPGASDAAQLALARGVPLWTWTLGGPVQRRDVWIETASSEALAFSGAEAEMAGTLRSTGFPNRSFKVELVLDDRVVAARDVVPDTNGTARVSFQVKAPVAGEQRYLLRTPVLPGETDAANNERALFLRCVGEKARVLVVEGQPHWDTKFLVQTLKRDPRVELTVVYRLNANRHLAVVSSASGETRSEEDLFPRTAAAMNAFDVIVLGREAEAFFDAGTEALLTDFVARRGGSLVFARGKAYGGRFPALAKLEPLAWGAGNVSQVRFHATEAGRDCPVFDLGAAGALDDLLNRLPALDQAGVTYGEKPLAVALATAGSDGPVLAAHQRYGQGRVLSLNVSGLWRWAFGDAEQVESEQAYHRFWLGLLQWLLGGNQFLPGADASLTSSRRHYTSEQPLQFLITTRNLDRATYQPRLVIHGGGRTLEVEPRARGEGLFAEAGPFTPGSYQVTLRNNIGKPAEITQTVDVVDASVEKRELSADPELMRELARISGGLVISENDVPRMAEVLRRWEASRELALRQRPLWDRSWLLIAALALLGAEWWTRRREGLL